MSALLPLAAYNLAVQPYVPTQAIESDLPMTIRITLAAIDPESQDDDEQPSTLRILKSSPLNRLAYDSDEEFDSEDDSEEGSEDDDEEVEEDEEDDDDEQIEDDDEDDDEDGDEDDSDFDEDDVEEYVVCTLSPKSQYQQVLDITISPEEEIFFVVTGSYPVHLTGNYVEHPFDGDADEFDSDEYDSEEEGDEDFDSDEYDLTPDEDELVEGEFDINDLEDDEDVEGKIEELVEKDEKKHAQKDNKKEKKDNKKRQAEEEIKVEVKETKKQKKEKKEKEEKKSVQFNEELEQGPTKAEKKPVVKTLAGGVTIEDRTVGKGAQAKNGSKVGVRYIGKLKNGSVFDKNTSGKPFQFSLGKGEVIKGWDIGVAGMAVGGERRIVIPAPFAYGKKKLPGIPANSELTFDVKLVTLK